MPPRIGVEGPLEYADADSSSVFRRSLVLSYVPLIGVSVSVTLSTLMTGLNLIAEYFNLQLCYCSLLLSPLYV